MLVRVVGRGLNSPGWANVSADELRVLGRLLAKVERAALDSRLDRE